MKERPVPVSTVESFINKNADLTIPLKDQMGLFEKTYIEYVLKNNHSNISRTAKILGLSRQSLQYRLKKLQIKHDKSM